MVGLVQGQDSGTLLRRYKWPGFKDWIRSIITKIPCYSPDEDTESIGPVNSDREQRLLSDDSGHQCSAVRRSNTAPASYTHVLPIASARKVADSLSNDSLGEATMHVHLDHLDQPDQTEICRCMLDTGSDFNLISERTLRILKLPFTPRPGAPTLTGLGGVPVLPIGSVVLTWHMDRHKIKSYSDNFWVISENMKPLFDVLLGKPWLKESNALVRNNNVIVVRRLG